MSTLKLIRSAPRMRRRRGKRKRSARREKKKGRPAFFNSSEPRMEKGKAEEK